MESEQAATEELELIITSDGTLRGTTITDVLTGRGLSMVKELRLHIKAGELYGTAEIILMKPQMNLTGKFKV